MRHALTVTRKAVLFLGVLTTAGVWSRPVTAQPAQPHETPASPEQQAQDGHDIQNYMNDAPIDVGVRKEGLLWELDDVPGSLARVRVLGGK